MTRTTRPWIVRLGEQRPAPVRLFCFPHAGSGVGAYRAFAAALSPRLEVYGVQLPGRETRFTEPPFHRLEPLLDALTPAITPLLDRPFAFFGHSLGALVSFELCRRLRHAGAPLPLHLFLSARGAAQEPLREERLHDVPDPALIDALARYGGAPAEVLASAELMELLLPTIRADFAVNETYAYRSEPPLPVPLSALGGALDETVLHERLEAWQHQTTAAFQLRIFPGDHFYIKPQQNEVTTVILSALGPHLAPGSTP